MIDQTVFQLVKASLFTNENVESSDWKSVFSEMKAQTIAALPGEWLKSHSIPEKERWTHYCLIQQAKWVRVMHGQDQLLKLLDQHGIPCVVLKGAAAAMAYPYPMLRTMGDVDFLVKRCDFDRTEALLEENGYELSHVKFPLSHHYEYSKGGIVFELHKRVSGVDESNERLISLLESGIDRREYKELYGYRFPVLPSELNGLVFILHVNHHIREGLGLRQIIDWMVYVDACSDEEWKRMVLLLRETGMERLALTVIAMSQKYLGLRMIVDSVDEYACDELMDYIMEKGNFGQKTGHGGKTASFALYASNAKSLFQRLQLGGMCQWDAAKKHKVLRPFAWIYQIFRIRGECISNGENLFEVIKQSWHGIKQRKLIEALGLTVNEKVY